MFSSGPRNQAAHAPELDITPRLLLSSDRSASALTEVELAYFAGLFDGEGSVSISHNSTSAGYARYQLTVQMQMIDKEALEGLADRWGGRVYVAAEANGNRRRTFMWTISSQMATRFLADIEPYIRLGRVRRKIHLAIVFQAQKAKPGGLGCKTPDSYRATQAAFYEQMRVLNRRGNHAPEGGEPWI